MNFKDYFEKFEADLRKRMSEEAVLQDSLEALKLRHEVLLKRLDTFLDHQQYQRKLPADPFFTNEEFIKLMNICSRTAQIWRDLEQISFSQISGKIYYRLSDIQKLLDDNYFKSIKKAESK